jgi:hypothetical protein
VTVVSPTNDVIGICIFGFVPLKYIEPDPILESETHLGDVDISETVPFVFNPYESATPIFLVPFVNGVA